MARLRHMAAPGTPTVQEERQVTIAGIQAGADRPQGTIATRLEAHLLRRPGTLPEVGVLRPRLRKMQQGSRVGCVTLDT